MVTTFRSGRKKVRRRRSVHKNLYGDRYYGENPKYSYYGGLGQPISNGIDMMIHNNYYGPVNV